MVGLARSAISRMLTEAREKGIVEIVVHHPFHYDQGLEDEIKKQLGLKHVSVIEIINQLNYTDLRKLLGKATAIMLTDLIHPGATVGVAWGTSVQATIEAYQREPMPKTIVVQLVGVLGFTRQSYRAQILVENLAAKLDGEGFYIYSPFIRRK